jgi:hypothetical protein
LDTDTVKGDPCTARGAQGDDSMVALERAALVAMWLLADGQCLTTREIANRLNMTRDGARYILKAISRKVPVYCDERGRWRRV